MHKQSSNRQRRLIVSALAAVLAPPALAQDRLSGAMPKEEVGALRLRAR